MPGVRQAWSSFSMAPRQKYGQDRGHVSVSGPMRGQHCRDLAQSQPRVTGTWVCRDKLLSDSIAVGCRAKLEAIHEFLRARETGPWLGSCLAATGLEPGRVGRAGTRHPCTVASPAQSMLRPGRSHIARADFNPRSQFSAALSPAQSAQ